MQVWVLYTEAEDTHTEIHGVYASKAAAYEDFMNIARDSFKFTAADGIHAEDDGSIWAGNGLDFLNLVSRNLTEQPQLT